MDEIKSERKQKTDNRPLSSPCLRNPRESAIIMFFFFIVSMTCYDIHENQLVVKILSVPIRRIPWDKFSGAVYIPQYFNGKKYKRGASIMLTLYPCESYDRNTRNITLYKWTHPIKAIRIYITEGEEKQYLRTIERCIGSDKCQFMPSGRAEDGSAS